MKFQQPERETDPDLPAEGTTTSSTIEQPETVSTTLEPTLISATTTSDLIPRAAINCQDYLDQCFAENYAIHEIYPPCSSQPFDVVCDLDTDPGGWIVFQRRFNGSEDFYRVWEDYKNGFGDLRGEFWLGLEQIYSLTRRGIWQLRVELEDFSGYRRYAEYTNFAVENESTYYRLSIGEYSGTAGDSLREHENMKFSTYDQDHDTGFSNCAMANHGAWWYNYCHDSNLNGRYNEYQVSSASGMTWWHWKQNYVLKKTEMKIRRTL